MKKTLAELLVDHPEIQAEIDDKVKAAMGEARIKFQEEMSVVAKFATSDTYPGPIRELAGKVLSGTASVVSLDAAIASYDATKEKEKSKLTEEEMKKQKETPGHTENLSDDGVIRSTDDNANAVARLKALMGKGDK